MQTYYAVERVMKEYNERARATAELQALRRRAAVERRGAVAGAWRARLGQLLGRRGTGRLAPEGRQVGG